jgi:antitoxin component of MazEF toxin-antitoxin module
MTRQLTKSGNSIALVLSKDMRDHLGLEDNEIEVTFEKGSIVLRAPKTVLSVKEAVHETLQKYDEAYRNLSK